MRRKRDAAVVRASFTQDRSLKKKNTMMLFGSDVKVKLKDSKSKDKRYKMIFSIIKIISLT